MNTRIALFIVITIRKNLIFYLSMWLIFKILVTRTSTLKHQKYP